MWSDMKSFAEKVRMLSNENNLSISDVSHHSDLNRQCCQNHKGYLSLQEDPARTRIRV